MSGRAHDHPPPRRPVHLSPRARRVTVLVTVVATLALAAAPAAVGVDRYGWEVWIIAPSSAD
ncbi:MULTISPECIES: hypothetical protein [unclassified Nocardia]|uniref:hypothetical protein n=1 Tax=unclassified Nocardia TaxID=2637762 RepID=UPI00278BD2D2|nr:MULTISPECIES: hypothetical protein [unclassified Nocardia]